MTTTKLTDEWRIHKENYLCVMDECPFNNTEEKLCTADNHKDERHICLFWLSFWHCEKKPEV